MSWRAVFAVIGGLLALTAVIPYIRDILRGTTKPQRASWLIWTALSGIALAGQYASGARLSLFYTVAQTIGVAAVLGLSLRHGIGGLAKLDIACLVGAAVGLILWWLTSNPLTALWFVVVIDALGVVPTLAKAWRQPESETALTWLMEVFGGVFTLASIAVFSQGVVIYPLYILIANVLVYLALVWSPHRRTA